ncbi:MAG: extracellular solute-binding protein [Elusimicrobia bacterium]|nr:extracellular solute-binding protein [Elusimicrobiota bacterium]
MPVKRALAVFLLLALAGCRDGGDANAGRTIVLWEQEDAAVAPFLDNLFAAFKKLPGNADVVLTRAHYQNEDLRQQFQTSSIAGKPPDLLLSPSDAAGVYSISGFLLPVDDLFDLTLYTKPVVEAITDGGKAWGVPMSNGNHLVLYYNKRLTPTPPATTDELQRFCATRAKELKLPHCLAYTQSEPFWLMPWLGAFGGWPMDGRKPTLDTPAMSAALDFVLKLRDDKTIPDECDYNCMDSLFKESQAAFAINGDWALPVYEKQLGKDLGVAKIPKVSATGRWPSPMVSGKYLMLSSALTGKKLELVRRFVEFATSEEMQVAQVRQLRRLPALTKAAKSQAVLGDPLLRASMEQVLAGKPMPMATEMRAVWDAIRPVYAKVLLRQISTADAARQMQKDAVTKIAEMNE